jgi:hypothetical protein
MKTKKQLEQDLQTILSAIEYYEETVRYRMDEEASRVAKRKLCGLYMRRGKVEKRLKDNSWTTYYKTLGH